MNLPKINHCPGSLAFGYHTYSQSCLNRVFGGKKVNHILPYDSPELDDQSHILFENNRKQLSISGVQEKYSVLLEKNKLRLIREGEAGTYILKPIPRVGRKPDQMPANEHLTMQIARQVYEIETAENALIFFSSGQPAYLTKRFDAEENGAKLAQNDFATLAQRSPYTHGEHYKYQGNYLEMFELLRQYVPAYAIEAPKLLKLLMFNYLFSSGNAHFKNFSVLETSLGDYRLSPAYDLLNSRIHIKDRDFALEEGLLPKNMAKGKVKEQFARLAELAGISEKVFLALSSGMEGKSNQVEKLIFASFLDESTQKNYWQSYQTRLKQWMKG